jgi:ABC-2 type transport system permease protein
MNLSANNSPAPRERAPSAERTLRRLFLTLFLRGRSARGLNRKSAPTSVGQKLALSLFFYFLLGLLAFAFQGKPAFSVAVYLHAMTFVFLGMFVASSAGEILFNKEEADILLHRPIAPRALLWAKVRVLVEISLWLAGALNLAGFLVGAMAPDSGWRFVIVHAISTALEALFCTGCVVMVYQLCLRWFGRERLDGLMTAAQIVVAMAIVLSGQLLPRFVMRANAVADLNGASWWIGVLPPAWFAGFDDVLAGAMRPSSWWLAALALGGTGLVLSIAFGKLARNYQAGLQTLNESVSPRARGRGRRRWIAGLVDLPPLRWWLREPVSRATFLLTAAYLVRDRETKLRVFPGIAPMLVIPIVFLIRQPGQTSVHGGAFGGSGFGVAFVGSYLGLIPLIGLQMLQYSQQWRAADIFRVAPLPGPAPVCEGARRAVLLLLTLPVALAFLAIVWLASSGGAPLALLLPGLVSLPVYTLVPSIGGPALPLSTPAEDAKSAGRGLIMFGVTMISMVLSGIAAAAWAFGWFWQFMLIETVVAMGLYVILRGRLANARWRSME